MFIDTHGLPIEFIIEKQLGIKTKQEILDFGIDKYNDACRAIVMKYSNEWKHTIERVGRWVDMENDYKTMDTSYMESVWWVFSELFKKGLVYRGYKVIYYSMGCKSPISNFEAKSNYQRVSDWAINIKFELVESKQQNTFLLVFTTTPWSLPANLAISVNPEFDYCKIKLDDEENGPTYIVGKPHLDRTLGKRKYTVLSTIKGTELVGLKYKPLFDYYKDYHESRTFKIYGADFVVAEKGTGLVHCAPAHGEEDYDMCLKNKLFSKLEIPPCPLDDDCNFTDIVTHFKGRNVKESENDIVAHLKETGQLFSKGKEVHDYPMCWRSDTPLLQKVCECWFINVEKLTSKLVENNAGVKWVPDFVGSNRFGEWLKNSQDWCVSRNRFWGTPINLWSNDSGSEVVCVNSIIQLETLAGLKPGSITDLHRHHIDKITIPSPTTGEPLHRVEFTFDCWLESGSMPYAQNHFPFAENSEFRQADFIAEGLDQTRGWFYTLLVIGTGLFGVSPYKNVIVNGIVLAEDGEKMSKRKNNYPPVDKILDEFGADALRLYLINTPVVKGGDIKFNPDEIREVARRYSMMLKNTTKFFREMVEVYKQSTDIDDFRTRSLDDLKKDEKITAMDEWILQCLNDLISTVHSSMNNYNLNGIVDKFYKFIDQLSRWYMNMNKKRYKRCQDTIPLDVLGLCLYYFSMISAPFAPFISEGVYQQLCPYLPLELCKWQSIHYFQIPDAETGVWNSDGALLELFDYVSDIIDAVRVIREKRSNPSTKLPLLQITLTHKEDSVLTMIARLEDQLCNELNIECIKYSTKVDDIVDYDLRPDVSVIKKRLQGREVGDAIKYVKQLSSAQKQKIGSTQTVPQDSPVRMEELKVLKLPRADIKVETTDRITLEYDDSITPEILEKYAGNQFHRAYQQARKDAKLVQTDVMIVEYWCSSELFEVLIKHGATQRNNAVYRGVEYIEPENGCYFLKKVKLDMGDVFIVLRTPLNEVNKF